MSQQELNDVLRGIEPPKELRARVIAAAVSAAAQRSSEADALDRRLSILDNHKLDLLYEGKYNPDYHKNMVTRFNLCDPDDSEHLQGLLLSVSR